MIDVDDVREMLSEQGPADLEVTAAAARIRERLVLPTAGPGDVVRLAGVWGGECHGRVVELLAIGVRVEAFGLLLLAKGTWRRDHARVFDCTSIERWKGPTPRAPRRPRGTT